QDDSYASGDFARTGEHGIGIRGENPGRPPETGFAASRTDSTASFFIAIPTQKTKVRGTKNASPFATFVFHQPTKKRDRYQQIPDASQRSTTHKPWGWSASAIAARAL